MDWAKVLDWLAVSFSVMLFIPGLGGQAYYNWKRGTTQGLHPVLVHLFPISVGLWLLWGIVRGLWPPIAPPTRLAFCSHQSSSGSTMCCRGKRGDNDAKLQSCKSPHFLS